MSGPDRGPLCLSCMADWHLGTTRHKPCRGWVPVLGRILACRCRCRDGLAEPSVVQAAPATRPGISAGRATYPPRAAGR